MTDIQERARKAAAAYWEASRGHWPISLQAAFTAFAEQEVNLATEGQAAALERAEARGREKERQHTESTLMYLGFHSAVDALRRAWEKSPLKQEPAS